MILTDEWWEQFWKDNFILKAELQAYDNKDGQRKEVMPYDVS